MEITIEALRLRRHTIEINIAMNQGALDEIDNIIGEMERRRGGRQRKITVINMPDRVEGGMACAEADLPSLDDVQGILRTDPPEAA